MSFLGGFSYSTVTVTANMFRQTTIVECSAVFVVAGVEGLEPSRTVLETGMLPLHHTPKERHIKLFCIIILS